ncbi:MAG: methyl-accepting chemotaxis protein [Myxococcaceae bacterium]|nr:methyl-accepting chemotaxis protein [Myxococcaceae bacterium]
MTTPLPKGRSRWLTNPSSVAVPLGALLGVFYVARVVTLPEGTRGWFAGLVILLVGGFNLAADAYEQGRLRTIRGLGDGTISSRPDTLERAAREASQAGMTTFLLAFACLGGGSLILAGLWYLIASPPLAVAVRVGLVGLLLGPLTAVMANLLVLPRARQVIEELMAAGLSREALATALPGREGLRRRLVIYAGVGAATPMLLVADANLHRWFALFERLAQQPDDAAARLVLAAEQSAGTSDLILLGVLLIGTVVLCGWLAGNALGQPLKRLGGETERLAQGRYERGRVVIAEFEPWAAANALSAMEAHLLDALVGAQDASKGIRTAAEELVENGAQREQGAAEQSAALMATTATTEELARSARQISANAQRVSEIARTTLLAAQAGKDSAEAFTSAMGQVRQGNQAIADSVVKLNKRVQQVGRIIEFIDGIADKSDLLALNAELEGHKAGSVGQGFGLVAAEMRRLAENVMTSTREISRLIEDIRDATNAAVMATEAGVKATDTGAGLATTVRDGLGDIVEFANLSADAMQSISLATAQQQAGSDQLVSAMEDINRSTRKNLESAGEMARTQGELVGVSRELEQAITTFGGTRS